jgi:hypothetical protein
MERAKRKWESPEIPSTSQLSIQYPPTPHTNINPHQRNTHTLKHMTQLNDSISNYLQAYNNNVVKFAGKAVKYFASLIGKRA